MNSRKPTMMRAIDHLNRANQHIADGHPAAAKLNIDWAIDDLCLALDIEPSEAAINDVVKDQAA